ncbi:MBL fold metallo-hydrolase [Limibacter armeniacum]|uniref:MBL fold metallo-hydrolase n=1 Tax=Limibacter armeniacum TaxID=466084 RepID=UPI002FE5E85B
MELIRTFHPVGQGAFYSERIIDGNNEYNVVYDCGSDTKFKNKVERIEEWVKDKEIHLLCISHLDNDHVNLVKYLVKHSIKIHKVMMPFINNEEKILLINRNRIFKEGMSSLLNNPSNFFGENVKILYIDRYEDVNDNNTTVLDLSDNNLTTEGVWSSGSEIIINHILKWRYIPYNFKREDRLQQFKNLLNHNNIDYNKLCSDKKYTLNLLKHDLKKLRNIFRQVDGNINTNSMLIFSLPSNSGLFQKLEIQRDQIMYTLKSLKGYTGSDVYNYKIKFAIKEILNKPGCIYTGDAKVDISHYDKIFKKYHKFIGTVQIPHHGSNKDFCIKLFNKLSNNQYLFCPVSFGEKNKYNHPTNKNVKYALDIYFKKERVEVLNYGNLSKKLIVIGVTEKEESTCIQIFQNKAQEIKELIK